MSAQGVDVQNLIKIDSAIAALRMREKRGFAWVFTARAVLPLQALY